MGMPGVLIVGNPAEAATHPHTLSLRSSNLVADAFSRLLPLELGEGKQYVEGQPARR